MIRAIKLFKQSLFVAFVSFAVLLIIFQPCTRLAMAESEIIKMPPLGVVFPFYDNSGTYIFGHEPGKGHQEISNAANW